MWNPSRILPGQMHVNAARRELRLRAGCSLPNGLFLASENHFAEIAHDVGASLSFHQILIFYKVRDCFINSSPIGMGLIFFVRVHGSVLVYDWFGFGAFGPHLDSLA